MSIKALILILLVSCLTKGFSKEIDIKRNISYSPRSVDNTQNLLDAYYPKNKETPKDVLVFIHGGSWNSGKKETYWWLGRNMAHKNVVAVIINYSLSPEYQYEKMAEDCASALKWVYDSIASYGGRSDRIFVMGHSAGAHLAALINSDPRFFDQQGIPNPVHAIILNDAFGLNMFDYLEVAEKNEQNDSFLVTFSKYRETWKKASPINYLINIINPYLICVGERTYPAIKAQSARMFDELSKVGKSAEFKLIGHKNHVRMISQMIFPENHMYDIVLAFMRQH